jgi:hypothetical protein
MGKGMGTAFASRALVRWLGIAVVVAGAATGAQAARIAGVTPQGEVAQVRQVMVRFSEAVVALGDPNRPPPMTLECSGPAPERTARWVNEKEWAIDFRSPLPPGVRCTLKRAAGWSPLQGTLDGPTDFSFSTGGPAIERSEPWDGATVSEDQHFLLRLNGAATPASVTANTWCEIDGIGERIPVQIVTGAARDELLKSRRITKAADAERTLLLACTRPLPPAAKLRVVWGAGIAAAADPKVVTRTPQRLRFEVRPRFTAEFSCERERAQAPCMPLGHARVSFSAPVPRELLAKLRLEPAGVAGAKPIAPKLQDNETQATEARFPSPLPESVAMKLTLPADLKDVDGRPLANAGSFPLTLSTGPMPPLAKFAAFPFGIIEHGPESMLPVTLRHVQGELRTGAVRVKTIAPKDWLGWMGKLAKAQDNEMKSRESALLAQQPDVRRMDLPQLVGGDPRPFEVIGIPLAEPGYHVVEIESKVLGERLLESRAPMFVRTGVLVTNLGVHFKRGHENSLVWVTTLDRAQPVPQADVALHDCRGKPLWQGRTDAQGRALVPLALPDVNGEEDCTWQGGYYVTAARQLQQQGRTVQDRAFVFSNWNRGIEPWRFNMVSSLYDEVRGQEKLRVHTIFDRTLLRAGETVSMKHLVRQESGAGLKDAEKSQLPTEMRIVHVGSGDEFKQPIQFDAAGRASLATWSVPPAAKLGLYDVQLKNAQHEWTSGRFRVEEFRLPVIDAKLMPPRGTLIAPSEAVLALQLNYLSGGGVARAPARASALLREREPSFPAYDSFSFRAPREDRGQRPDDEEGSSADGAKLVVDKQAVTTDAAGAATITLKGLPPSKRPAELHAEVSFNDPNGEVQTVSQRLPIWPAARVVGIRTGSWAAALGKVKFQAVLLDLNGKPLADGKVAVHARVTQWQANRKRLVGGFYAYDQSSVQKDLGAVCDGKTDARGLLLCEASIDAAGEVELVARAADEAGRVTEAATTVYVTRQGEFWFEQDNDDRIDILADKANYQPGDIAKLQVRMPYRQATALLSIEREGVIDTRVVTLQGDDPVIEITIPNRDAKAVKNGAAADATTWAPNVYASVLVVRGRVRHVPWYSFFNWGWKSPGEWWRAFRYEGREYQAPTAMVDLAKPSHKFGAVQLKVGLDAHRLDVKVTPDKTQYAVRQKVVTKVQVLQAGQPAAGAEIAFAAVDEALLALSDNSSWKVLEEMFPPRGWAVETSTAQGEIIGRRHYGRKALPAGGGGGRNPTRELFDTLLLWRGSVVLDAKGEATIEVPLNDSLTSFRLVALATAGADRFGTGSATVKVTQDLQMLPGLPPLAREGDQYDAIYTLRNTTGREMKVEAALAANAQRDDGAGGITRTPITFAPQAVTLPAGGAAEVKWPLQVPAGVFSLAFEASVRQAGGAAGPGDTAGRPAAIAGGATRRCIAGRPGQARWPARRRRDHRPAADARVRTARRAPLFRDLSVHLSRTADLARLGLEGHGGVDAHRQCAARLPGQRRPRAVLPPAGWRPAARQRPAHGLRHRRRARGAAAHPRGPARAHAHRADGLCRRPHHARRLGTFCRRRHRPRRAQARRGRGLVAPRPCGAEAPAIDHPRAEPLAHRGGHRLAAHPAADRRRARSRAAHGGSTDPAAHTHHLRRHGVEVQHRGIGLLVVADGLGRCQRGAPDPGGGRRPGLEGRGAAHGAGRTRAPAARCVADDDGEPVERVRAGALRRAFREPAGRWPLRSGAGTGECRARLDCAAGRGPAHAAVAGGIGRHAAASAAARQRQALAGGADLGRRAAEGTDRRGLPAHAQHQRRRTQDARRLDPRRRAAREAGDRGAGRHDLGRDERPGADRCVAARHRPRPRLGHRHQRRKARRHGLARLRRACTGSLPRDLGLHAARQACHRIHAAPEQRRPLPPAAVAHRIDVRAGKLRRAAQCHAGGAAVNTRLVLSNLTRAAMRGAAPGP